jgi:3-dehydroquinate synthase
VALDGGRDYEIVIGAGLLADAQKILAERFPGRKLLTLCDAGAQTHLPAVLKKDALILEEGENTKTLAALERTLAWILDHKPDRKTMIVAFGGGVAGDHAGFAAAICLRGLDYIQIPTTLLAQVDSSVGGKTGINAAQGKNLIGAFHQPRLVLIDTDVLSTLAGRQMRAGYAEIVKYSFIGDRGFFDWLSANGQKVLAGDAGALAHAIATSCAAKAAVVAEDERETGRRALLNFGHTFAHALEAACHYDRRLLHGEAVAIGMALAFDVSRRMALCSAADAGAAIDHMQALGLKVHIRAIGDFPPLTADDLIGLMGSDKKISDGRLTFILCRGIGSAFATQDVAMDAVREALISSLGA